MDANSRWVYIALWTILFLFIAVCMYSAFVRIFSVEL